MREPARRHLVGGGLLLLALAVLVVGAVWALRLGSRDEAAGLRAVIFSHDEALLRTATRGDDGSRFLVVLIPFDRTRFFLSDGEPRGFEYELVRSYEAYVNERRKADEPAMQALFVPTPFDQLVPLLAEGVGDIAAGGLTVTPARASQVLFSEPYLDAVSEVVVQHRGIEGIERLEDLAGRTILALRGSSYAEHLVALAARFEAEGRPSPRIVESDVSLMSEDLLEMVNAGIVGLTVVDRHIAELWARVLPDIVVRDDLEIAGGGTIAWAVRPGATELKKDIDAFMATVRKGTLIGNVLFERYYENTRWVTNPLSEQGLADLARYRELFERYGERYDFDWRLIAALAYQESRFDADAVSPRGAVGLMQLLPSTAKEMGFENLRDVETNIHAGVKYLAQLRDSLAAGTELSEAELQRFALAAYNAGPSRLAELRSRASEDLGLDPDRWFFNVERAAQRARAGETVRYVANVTKYYLAYTLGEALLDARARTLPRSF